MKEATSLDVLRWEAWLCGGCALVVVVCLAMVVVLFVVAPLWGGQAPWRTRRR
jgi:hypothetical protein